MSMIRAQFRAECECGTVIEPGDLIEPVTDASGERIGWKHADCQDDPEDAGTPCSSCWLVHAGGCL